MSTDITDTDTIRFAQFNASLNRATEGQLSQDLSDPTATTPGANQAKAIAEIIQRTNPDVALIGKDAFGFGNFSGQFGMLLLSKYPIDIENGRTFQNLLWKDMLNSLLSAVVISDAETPWYLFSPCG